MIILNGQQIEIKKFPNGECYCDIGAAWVKNYDSEVNKILLKFENDEDILFLQFIKDYLDDVTPEKECNLYMPYIPYSRMDRYEFNRLFTLRSFCNMVNNMNFRKVYVLEPHSDVSSALLRRLRKYNVSAKLAGYAMCKELGIDYRNIFEDNDEEAKKALNEAKRSGIYLIYPDASSEKRYRKQIPYYKILTCDKERDFNTGKIKSIKANNIGEAQDCRVAIIVDDLCAKGDTALGCAKALYKSIPKLEKVVLCVAHCENIVLGGAILSEDTIQKIYTTDSMLDVNEKNKKFMKFRDKFELFSAWELCKA